MPGRRFSWRGGIIGRTSCRVICFDTWREKWSPLPEALAICSKTAYRNVTTAEMVRQNGSSSLKQWSKVIEKKDQGMGAHTFNPCTRVSEEDRSLSLQTSLVYREASRIPRATHREKPSLGVGGRNKGRRVLEDWESTHCPRQEAEQYR